MSNVAGIVLYSVLNNPETSANIWPRLKVYFFTSEYSPVYLSILKYYNKYNSLPSFEELKIVTRDESFLNKIRALELLPVSEDIDMEIATEALIDQYTQDEALTQLSTFVDHVVEYDTEEVKQKLSEILLDIEEKTESSESIFLMNDLFIIDKEEAHSKIPLGLNNAQDARDGGTALTELIMVGGYRGDGKSVVGCNIATNQYKQKNTCLYFSIEMRGREVFNRFMSILSGVDNSALRKMSCTREQFDKLAETRSNMFVDAEEVYRDFVKHNNYEKFEVDLIRSKKLKSDNQLIIIDNQQLTLADIDMNIQKFKLQFGDKLKLVVVDYINQIQIPDIYDWKQQIMLSKKLKEIARKYNIVMVTPYQIDKSGEARFSKGILDKADVAVILEKNDKYISIETTKTRDIAAFKYNAPITWETFAMSPLDYITENSTEDAQEII